MQAELGLRARIAAPVRASGSPATVVAALSAAQGRPLGDLVGLHLRHRHRLVGDHLWADLQDSSAT